MDVREIRTPTDMRGAFADAARTHFIGVPEEVEPDMRAAWAEIYDDFTLMEPAFDPPGLVESYLDSIADPLARLRALGLQLVAITSSGQIELIGTTIQGTQTDFLVAPSPCWFRRDDAVGDPVHLLGARCIDGHRVFTESGPAVRLYRSRETVEQAFEGNAPWCPTCAMAEIEST